MVLVTWLSNYESSTPCQLLPNYAGVDLRRSPQRRSRTVGPGGKGDGGIQEVVQGHDGGPGAG